MERSGGRRKRRSLRTIAAAISVLMVAACANQIHGEPISEGQIAGMAITHFESGLKDTAPTPELSVTNVSDSEEDRLAIAAIADVSAFWSKQFPLHFGQEFEPVAELRAHGPPVR